VILDRTNVFVHAMPATPLADTNLWRVTVQWMEHTHWQRFDVSEIKEKARFIREFGDKIGAPWETLIWLDGAIDQEVREWVARNEENELLDRRVTLLLSRMNDQEKAIAAMDEALTEQGKRLDRIANFCNKLLEERKAGSNGKQTDI
jgi:uncharacterized coiled-coil protein SlyX